MVGAILQASADAGAHVDAGTATTRGIGRRAPRPAQPAGLDGGPPATMLATMDTKPTPPDRPAPDRPACGKPTARQEREAAALRTNLRKRKDQARAREKPKQE